MSGFNGIYFYKEQFLSLDKFNELRDRMHHRGPDKGETFNDEKAILGQRTLNTEGREIGRYRIHHPQYSIAIVFDGQFYNYKEIAQELKIDKSLKEDNVQEEVFIRAYREWGLETALNRVDGSFTCAIWDYAKQKLFITRDKYGIKPLYYTENENGFHFGSDLRTLTDFIDKRNLSKTAINLLFSLRFIPAPYSIYENVFKVEPGYFIELDEKGMNLKRYFNLLSLFESENKKISFQNAKIRLRESLINSIEKRTAGIQTIQSFLSGGIDSSIISIILADVLDKKPNTYAVGFSDKEADESRFSQLVAEAIGTNHISVKFNYPQFEEVINDILHRVDEPFGSVSAVPMTYLMREVSERGNVILGGESADELFGGYSKYLMVDRMTQFNKLPSFLRRIFLKSASLTSSLFPSIEPLRKVKRFSEIASLSPIDRYIYYTGTSNMNREKILSPEMYVDVKPIVINAFEENRSDEASRMMYSDLKLLSRRRLTNIDKIGFQYSVESRVPFLNDDIVKLSGILSNKIKMKGGVTKRVLKDAFSDLLPEEIHKKPKKGFVMPIGKWFKAEEKLKEELENLLSPSFIKRQGIFNAAYCQKIKDEHFAGQKKHTDVLWMLYFFQSWYKYNVVS